MRITLQTQGFELTSAINAHAHKQLSRNLASSERHITSVDVFLGDINGPRGGIDKRALVCVQLSNRLAVRFEAVHTDLYAAISIAARRARHNVKRALRRQKRMEKAELRGMRHFPGELLVG